jgi:hypothetical protein
MRLVEEAVPFLKRNSHNRIPPTDRWLRELGHHLRRHQFSVEKQGEDFADVLGPGDSQGTALLHLQQTGMVEHTAVL